MVRACCWESLRMICAFVLHCVAMRKRVAQVERSTSGSIAVSREWVEAVMWTGGNEYRTSIVDILLIARVLSTHLR